jgi:hypothetical protein
VRAPVLSELHSLVEPPVFHTLGLSRSDHCDRQTSMKPMDENFHPATVDWEAAAEYFKDLP